MTKLEFVELLKMIDELDLFDRFLKSQRKLLESKGLASQFAKMDVKKLKELMKVTLAVHADWPKWLKALHMLASQPCGSLAMNGCTCWRACGLLPGYGPGWRSE